MMSHTGKSFRRGTVWRCPAESISALKAEAMAVAVLVFANMSLAQQPSSAYASSLISNRSNDMSVHTATQKRQIRMLVGEKKLFGHACRYPRGSKASATFAADIASA